MGTQKSYDEPQPERRETERCGRVRGDRPLIQAVDNTLCVPRRQSPDAVRTSLARPISPRFRIHHLPEAPPPPELPPPEDEDESEPELNEEPELLDDSRSVPPWPADTPEGSNQTPKILRAALERRRTRIKRSRAW